MTSYTTPATATAGTPATAADFNTHRDGVLHLRERTTQRPKVRAYWNGTTQSIATGTPTAVTLDTELLDSHAMHDNSTNNTRLTAPTGYDGWYQVGGCVEFDANATGIRELYIRKNGSTIEGRVRSVPASGQNWQIEVFALVYLAAGSYVELIANQSSGGNLNLNKGSQYAPHFWAYYVGEDD